MRRIALALIAFLSLSGLAVAHNGVEHLRGTVTQITDKAVTIQVLDKQEMSVALAADTTFLKSGKAAKATDLKVGDKVVIDYVEKGRDMTAKAVKFGPAAAVAKATAAQGHEGHEGHK